MARIKLKVRTQCKRRQFLKPCGTNLHVIEKNRNKESKYSTFRALIFTEARLKSKIFMIFLDLDSVFTIMTLCRF